MEFNPEIILEPQELADLAGILPHPGIKVLQKIARSCVDQFVLKMINAEDDEDVLKRHKYAKIAAQLLTAIANKVNQDVQDYAASRPTSRPIDVTENLDIGEFTTEEELF